MAHIKIDWPAPPIDGAEIKFKAPCDCTAVEGLLLSYPDAVGNETSKSFTFHDSHANDLTGLGNLFVAGAYVKVILDTKNGRAYIQNAVTNAYLESKKRERVVELLPDGWQNNAQTVAVDGVTADNTVIVSAAPENHTEYGEYGVHCSAQAPGALTFTCADVPTVALRANVVILA